MEFRLLGSFEAGRSGKPVAVGRRRQERLLLAILLLDAGRPVTIERLTDLLWDGEPPASSRGTVRILSGDPRLERPAAPVYSIRVRDHRLPWSVGGHPALELCNTYAGWGGERAPGAEWLRGYPTLAVWAGHQDLLDDATVTKLLRAAQRDPLGAAAVLDEARDLRRPRRLTAGARSISRAGRRGAGLRRGRPWRGGAPGRRSPRSPRRPCA